MVIGLLLLSGLLSVSLVRSRAVDYRTRLHEFPMAIGPWQGRDVQLTSADLVYAVLETSAVLSRIYESPSAKGQSVDLLVTYFERGHRGFHPPEVSFVARGNTITRSEVVQLPVGDGWDARALEANMFLGHTPRGEVLYLYWFGVGDRLMANYYKGTMYLMWNALWQRPSSASMVRVALPVLNGDVERAMATATGLIRQIVPLLPAYLAEEPRSSRPQSRDPFASAVTWCAGQSRGDRLRAEPAEALGVKAHAEAFAREVSARQREA